jgi:hypothetical protein
MRSKIFNVAKGISNDIEPGKSGSGQGLYGGINTLLSEENGVYALTNLGGMQEIPFTRQDSDANHEAVAAFECRCAYRQDGGSYLDQDSLVVLTNNGVGDSNIYIVNLDFSSVYKIYDDASRPSRDRSEGLNIGKVVDGFHTKDGRDNYLIWVDNENPIRSIKLEVNDAAVYDNSTPALSPLFIANEPDLLLLQRLYPVDMLDVSGVSEGGALVSGHYCFVYRYYNTETQRYGAWSLFTQPLPVVTNGVPSSTNDIISVGEGVNTNLKVSLALNKSHFHKDYYDSVQVAWVVYTSEVRPAAMFVTDPSKDYYTGSGNIVITGSEKTQEVDLSDANVGDSQILTCKTIEEENGRMFLGNITYREMDVPDPTLTSAQTIKHGMDVEVDPMERGSIAGAGYADPLNTYSKKGYWRGECYRFAKVYINKFGHTTKPVSIDFSSLAGYNPASHNSTWQLNWASAGTDWKFLDRESSQGSLFSQTSDQIEAIGLRLQGVGGHPSWAYAVAIVRARRIPDIIGQTPVINGVPASGVSYNTGFFFYLAPYTTPFGAGQGGYDYTGQADTFVPKLMSTGVAKGILQERANVDSNTGVPFTNTGDSHLYYGVWKRNFCYTGPAFDQRPDVNLYYLFPLEFLANNGDRSVEGFSVDKSSSLKIIDTVILKAFNGYRNRSSNDTRDPSVSNADFFKNGHLNRLAWVFAPSSKSCYYYHNSSNPVGGMTTFKQIPQNGDRMIACVPDQDLSVAFWKFLSEGHAKIEAGRAFSSDKRIAHITSINGLAELVDEMSDSTQMPYDLLTLLDSRTTYPDRNPRCLVVALDVPNTGNINSLARMIGDPTQYLLQIYGASGSAWNGFTQMFPGAPTIDAQADYESPVYGNAASGGGEADINVANYSSTIPEEGARMIDPGSGVAVFIANITTGAGDDRYARNGSSEYVLTGAYMALTSQDTSGSHDFDVFGGDCYITRLAAQIRSTGPKLGKVQFDLSANPPYIYHNRTFNFDSLIEFVDLWVESSVNGHYVSRDSDQYPSGFITRPPANEDYSGSTNYEYPYTGIGAYAGVRKYLTPLSSAAHGGPNAYIDVADEIDINDLFGANHLRWSGIAVRGTREKWDRFRANDLEIMESQQPISKITRGSDNRLVVIQEDGVVAVYLGQVLSLDAAQVNIALSSGDVVGTVRQTRMSPDTSGEFGIFAPTHAMSADGKIYCVDARRKRMFIASENGVRQIDTPRIRAMLNDTIPNVAAYTHDTLNLVYDKRNARMMAFGSVTDAAVRAVTVLDALGTIIEPRIQLLTKAIKAWSPNAAGDATIISSDASGFKAWSLRVHESDRATQLGNTSENNFEIIVNGDGGMNCVIYGVRVRASNSPTSLDITPMDAGHVDGTPVLGKQFTEMRDRGIFACTDIWYPSNKRVSGRSVRLTIHMASAKTIQVSSVEVIYRNQP